MAKWEWIEKSFCLLEKIYRIGGVANNAMPLTLNSVVNLSNGIITEAPGLTVMRKSAAAAATDNFIFVFGGTNPTTGEDLSACEKYWSYKKRNCQISFHHIV